MDKMMNGHSPRGRVNQTGFTLIELMIVVGVIGILSAIALPIYNNYVQTSTQGALLSSISTIRVFQEDFRMRTGEYAEGTYDNGADANLLPLGWDPQTDDVVFVVVANAGNSYTVTATGNSGMSVCRQFPDVTPC